eukprot:TRINITY_DN8568_c0_g2_i1.p1 TRINITY_DN8568_c0_g2~~TRINITY_DN8568_c0_g2_i1.p1  ORF type:complete len:601 (+),score=105.30 TRINITY_DN8568_c0_g2_i1:173-1975(+)
MQPQRAPNHATPPPPPPRVRKVSLANTQSGSSPSLLQTSMTSPRSHDGLSDSSQATSSPALRSLRPASQDITGDPRTAPALPPRLDGEQRASVLRQAQIARLSGRMSQEITKLDAMKQATSYQEPTTEDDLGELKSPRVRSPPASFSRKPSIMEIPNLDSLLSTNAWEEEITSIIYYDPPMSQFPAHRDKVARELFTTEATYVRNLRFVVKECMRPLEDIIQGRDIFVIFSYITQILNVNETLLKELHNKILVWNNETTLSDVMQYLIPFLKMYTNYCAGFDDAVKKMAELEKQNSRFAQFLLDIKSKPGANGLDLRSFLILPVQRIPRYTLLLQDFIKHTEETHADYDGLVKALIQVKEVASKVNDAIKEQENRNRILDIHSKFNGELQLVDPHRRFILEGSLVKVCRKDDRRRHFYLFNDLLIYGQRNSDGTMKLSQKIGMHELSVTDDTSEEYHGFVINSSKKSFVAKADTLSEKETWIKSINDQINLYRMSLSAKKDSIGSVDIAPVWKQDSTATGCKICSIRFTITNRRHHCRKCGEVVCGDCSTRRYPVAGVNSRVCDECFTSILSPVTTAAKLALAAHPSSPSISSTGTSSSN